MMKNQKFTIILWLMLLLVSQVNVAQQDVFPYELKKQEVERLADSLHVRLLLDVSAVSLASDRSIIYTPVLSAGDSMHVMPSIVLNGKRRHILYQRLDRQEVEEFAYRRTNGQQQAIDYQISLPFAQWMEMAEVSLITDDCGCGWESLTKQRKPLFSVRLVQPEEPLVPQLVYVMPEVEVVKDRSLEGRAYLDFPLDEIEIYPQYRNNPLELAKIHQTIESVRTDPFATIHTIRIKGFASPEGSYAHNAYLAENRAKALLAYVSRLHELKDVSWQVDFEPEDWEGFERMVAASKLSDKQELLAIIRNTRITDPDHKEKLIKQLNGGRSYPALLEEILPALRHSDYVVGYTICHFSVEDARELVFTNPRVLSLNEMFLAAQTFEAGSDRFNEIFETAVRLYPDDPVSNLNAAVTALRQERLDLAETYLAKSLVCPERQLAASVVCMMQGRWQEAAAQLKMLLQEPSVSKAAQENLRQVQQKLDRMSNSHDE